MESIIRISTLGGPICYQIADVSPSEVKIGCVFKAPESHYRFFFTVAIL
jgi:hypothetical protein